MDITSTLNYQSVLNAHHSVQLVKYPLPTAHPAQLDTHSTYPTPAWPPVLLVTTPQTVYALCVRLPTVHHVQMTSAHPVRLSN